MPLLPDGVSTARSFVYDPRSPVPTDGGNNLFPMIPVGCGPKDQSKLDRRSDVLTFTSAALAQDVAVTGPLKAILYVSSNASDTDFTVKLTDVYPTGESMLIAGGYSRKATGARRERRPSAAVMGAALGDTP